MFLFFFRLHCVELTEELVILYDIRLIYDIILSCVVLHYIVLYLLSQVETTSGGAVGGCR